MRSVTVKKANLLETMKANREQHRAIFLEAQTKYREKAIESLDRRLADTRAGGPIRLTFNLPEPVDYTTEYDNAIAQMEWHVEDEVVLTEQEFNQYVLDKWGWEGLFTANTRSYTS